MEKISLDFERIVDIQISILAILACL